MKRNSWHYRLAKLVDTHFDDRRNSELTICNYISLVIAGAVLLLSIVFISSMMVWFIGVTIYEAVGTIFGFAELSKISEVVLWLTGAFVAFVLYAKFMQYRWLRRFNDLKTKQTDSFFGNVYKSWKQKFCFYVKFED